MSCYITKGRNLSGCYENFGGLKTIFIANFDDVDSITESNNSVTGITMSGTTDFYQFDLHEKAGVDEFSEELNFEISNSAKSYTQNLTLLFNKYGKDERDIIKALASTNTITVAKDNNDNYWMLGKTRGCHLSATETGSGAELTARNGSQLTLTATEPEPMAYVDNSSVDIESISTY